MTTGHIIIGSYFAVLLLLMVYCLHRYWILLLYFRHRKHGAQPLPLPDNLPPVTVQLPVYNELYVVQRLIHAAAQLIYPRHLLEIQVLDDSTDETSRIAENLVLKLRQRGYHISCLHRRERTGFKAGALQQGLQSARGELIAIFDADFVPKPDFLVRSIGFFNDPRIGMVQSRWGHINRRYSLLTRLQAMLLDAHFILEHTARNRSGRFFNFNGTAGIWRRQCITETGGWRHDTLTEDLDLSYRAQLRGWRFLFLPDVVTPGEIPIDMNSFKSQQHRWSKGGIETAQKILPTLMKSSLPARVRCEAFFHLTSNANYLLLVLLALLAYPALVVRITMGWKHLFVWDLVCFIASVIPIALYYCIASREACGRWIGTLCSLPLLMSLGIGMSINNGKGVLEALAGRKSAFLRTPKFRIENSKDTWRYKRYHGYTRTIQTLTELGLGIYFLSAIAFAVRSGVYASIPFLSLFCCGFLCVSLFSLYQQIAAPGFHSATRGNSA